jgi:hypothetical protein
MSGAQDNFFLNPYQLAMGTSSARLADPKFGASGLAQAFYQDSYYSGLALYLPYTRLTDSEMAASILEVFSPSFAWGAFGFNYASFSAENLGVPVFNIQSIKLGYANAIFNCLVFSTWLKWNNYKWYSGIYEDISVEGFGLDFNMIYIMDGFSSVGLRVNNLIAPQYSSVNDDGAARALNLSYHRILEDDFLNMEGGFSWMEDYRFKTKSGMFINSELKLTNQFSLAAEYKRQFYNEFGAAITFLYTSTAYQAQISYGIRLDDSPFPVSALRQAFGLSIKFTQFRESISPVNPQILFRDESGPEIRLERVSEYTLFTYEDESDILKLKVLVDDDQSGISSVSLEISAATDSTDIIYSSTSPLKARTYSDTLIFEGYDQSGNFIGNRVYRARILARDQAGNKSGSYYVPFRALAKRNDSEGPVVNVEFDTSSVEIKAAQADYVLNAFVTVNEQSDSRVHWSVQLYKQGSDSAWTALKPQNGSVEINNRPFEWLLRRGATNAIQGVYKIKVDAYDELRNLTRFWTAEKIIIDNYQPAIAQEQPEKVEIDVEPVVIFLSEPAESVTLPATPEQAKEVFSVNASYTYKNREIRLTEFKFERGYRMKLASNQQSLSVIGFFMQDLPQSELLIEYPEILTQVYGFEEEIVEFFRQAYGIDAQRIAFKKSHVKSISFRFSD